LIYSFIRPGSRPLGGGEPVSLRLFIIPKLSSPLLVYYRIFPNPKPLFDKKMSIWYQNEIVLIPKVKKEKTMIKRTISSPVPASAQESKTVSLRLPGKLSDLAQRCAESSGLSLNGLICSALADYLAARGYKVFSR
jgi:hypothetical protein